MTLTEVAPDDTTTVVVRTPAAAVRETAAPWRAAMTAALAVWSVIAVARLAVTGVSWLARGTKAPTLDFLLHGWNAWDAQHYVTIAARGYHVGPGYPAFFPLFPMLIHGADPLLPGDGFVAAVVIANLAAIGALAVLFRLAEHEFGRTVAKRAAWYLAIGPMGFFLFIGYNESLFLLLSIGALYAARRGHWWLAGSLGMLSSATRLFGLLLVLPLVIEYVRVHRHRFRVDVLAIGLVPLGLAAFAVFCAIDLGNPLAFSKAQDQWGRAYTFPGGAWVQSVQQLGGHDLVSVNTVATALDAGTILVAVVLLVLSVRGTLRFRRDQMYLVAHAVLTIALLTSTTTGGRAMQSVPRYAVEAIAVLLVLARAGANELVDRFVVITGVSLQTVLLVVFMTGTFLIA